MRDWIDLIDVIERYARLEGCARMRLEGRNGWKRLLPTYRQAGVILEKRL
jgi:hypothetical protein